MSESLLREYLRNTCAAASDGLTAYTYPDVGSGSLDRLNPQPEADRRDRQPPQDARPLARPVLRDQAQQERAAGLL